MAQTGIPAQQYNNQENDIQRSQAGGLAALSNSANPGSNVASIVRAGNDATNTLNGQDAMQRNRNLLNLLQERQVLAQQKDKAWDWNYQQRYLGNLAKANSLRGSSNANINGGLNDLSGTVLTTAKLGGFGDSSGGGLDSDTNFMNASNYAGQQAQQDINSTTQGFNQYLLNQ